MAPNVKSSGIWYKKNIRFYLEYQKSVQLEAKKNKKNRYRSIVDINKSITLVRKENICSF